MRQGTNLATSKKLIEVALPLEAINVASAREKSIRHGHPSTLHLWWARRPLAAARAVIFAQMVDDPAEYADELLADPGKRRRAERDLAERRTAGGEQAGPAVAAATEQEHEEALAEIAASHERERLFRLLRELVKWENTTNERLLDQARAEIRASWRRTCERNKGHPRAAELFDPEKLPAFHDPFAGGGALPLEAQRLGLEAHASDLNPVAVLINKAMIEVPPKFAGRSPVNPGTRSEAKLVDRQWRGAQGLADDVRYYGRWMRDQAKDRIGHLYPQVEVTREMVRDRPDLKQYEGRKLTVIAWLWARTLKSPNPAYADVDVPLVSTFMLSTKKGKEAYVEPLVEGRGYRFEVKVGAPLDASVAKAGTKLSRGSFRCLASGVPIRYEYIDDEANAGRMRERLMAIVLAGDRGRVYVSPLAEADETARSARPTWKPDAPSRGTWASNAQGRRYGFRTFGDYFTPRQLVALTTFSDLVGEATERVHLDAVAAGLPDDGRPLHDGGTGATAYAEAVGLYLALALSKTSNVNSSITSWMSDRGAFRETFARQAIPMVWDFAEANSFAGLGGSFDAAIAKGAMAIEALPARQPARARQMDAASEASAIRKVVSTDPPYYDNIGYADLSDYFYVWLRRSVPFVFPGLFSTLAVPKSEELVASPYRHGGKAAAETFFLAGMTRVMERLAEQSHTGFPITVYYAFKQSERKGASGVTSTGWETFLGALVESGLSITGTWPMRTEGAGRILAKGTNALASSIVLVCRPRPADAPLATRREFLAALRAELPQALRLLQTGNVAPVDLAQAAIGPGMAVYTRYERVLEPSGQTMSVREALVSINRILDEMLTAKEGDLDPDSRWAIAWFEESGFNEGDYGSGETLAKAKVTSVEGLVTAGILRSRGGKVQLLRAGELDETWDPTQDSRLSVWEALHHLIRVLESDGEQAAGDLHRKLGGLAGDARELCYRLFALCEHKKWPAEALLYNRLVQSWPEIARISREAPPEQRTIET
ncbi:MAG: DUF1156 domain-containing protein [Acidobacteria bacterium]|nr:DUF1156 domain-containing protein [Acidobacteriota bacterium]